MARSRNIKPGFFKNEELAELGPYHQLTYEGLWVLADREGRLEDRPKRIKIEIFPYYDEIDMDKLLQDLNNKKFIVRYEIEGEKYIWVIKFKSHQNPHPNEAKSIIPPVPSEIMKLHEDSIANNADSLFSDSLFSDSLLFDSKENSQEETPPPDITQEEILVLNELKKVKGYKFEYSVDLAFIRKIKIDYPFINTLAQIRTWCSRKIDEPLRNKSKPHSQLANWFMKAEEWRKEREAKNNGGTAKNRGDTPRNSGVDGLILREKV